MCPGGSLRREEGSIEIVVLKLGDSESDFHCCEGMKVARKVSTSWALADSNYSSTLWLITSKSSAHNCNISVG